MSNRLTRRSFVTSSAAAAVGAGLATRAARAADRPRAGANEALNVGVIGTGGRGGYLGYLFQITPGVRLRALCDVYQAHLDKIARQCVNVDKERGAEIQQYRDFRELLDDPAIDAVVIATNEHWHVLPAIHACQAAKDVYLEKPMGTTIAEGRALIEAVDRHERVLQMGTQQHTWEHYHQAVEIVQSGTLGEISLVEVWDADNFHPGFGSPPDEPPPQGLDWDFWLGPAPKVPYNRNRQRHHYWFHDYGGAWQVAWGVHHYDIVHWAMGVQSPVTAVGLGAKLAFESNCEWPDTFGGECVYPPGPVAKHGFLMQYTCRAGSAIPKYGRTHGKAFHGAHGSLFLDRSGFEVVSETRDKKKVTTERKVASAKSEHDVVRDHIAAFVENVRARKSPVSGARAGHEATLPGLLMNIALRLGRQVRFDPSNETFIGDAEANGLITKAYREPWSLPA